MRDREFVTIPMRETPRVTKTAPVITVGPDQRLLSRVCYCCHLEGPDVKNMAVGFKDGHGNGNSNITSLCVYCRHELFLALGDSL